MQIIGITGFKRSGKGETAQALSRNHTGLVYEIGFADKLKILAAEILGYKDLPPREAIALMDTFKEDGFVDSTYAAGEGRHLTGRKFLQNLGGSARKILYDTVWIDRVLPQPTVEFDMILRESYVNARQTQDDLGQMYPDVDCLAFTDLRYPNEAERVLACGGVVWEVVRPGVESDGDASEQPLPRDLVTYTINNDGDLADLDVKVRWAMEATL